MSFCRFGRLTPDDAECFEKDWDTEDIVFNHQSGNRRTNKIELSDGYVGLRCRGGGSVQVGELHVSRVKSDAVCMWNGGSSIDRLYVNHSLPVKYTPKNHPDCFQGFAKRLASDEDQSMLEFDGLYIGYAEFIVKSHGPEDKKNFVIFSERDVKRNIHMFGQGVDCIVEGEAVGPYLIHSTNFIDSKFGSEDYPLDPERTAGRGIRISDQDKPGSPESFNIIIHAMEDYPIELEGSPEKATTVYRYRMVDGKPELIDPDKPFTYEMPDKIIAPMPDLTNQPREMSPAGIKQLIDSEGSECRPYRCEAGVETIGVGHALLPHEKKSGKIVLSTGYVIDFRDGRELESHEIEALLQDDLISRRRDVERLIDVKLNQSQFDCLVHWHFNTGALAGSTLRKKLNQGLYGNVPAELRKWVYVTTPAPGSLKRVSKGLANRREIEVSMWLAEDEKFNTSDYLNGRSRPVATVPAPDYDAPFITEREERGITKPMGGKGWVELLKDSRITKGGAGAGAGTLGLFGFLTALSSKVEEVIFGAIDDPANAIDGLTEAKVSAAKLVSGASDLTAWFMWGGGLVIVVLLFIIWLLLARKDDRDKGIN